MGNRKALFFDIDGTLLSEGRDRKVPESARKALLQAREKGHLVFVNTGRTWCETKEVRHLIDADGWLCGCGTYLMAEGEVLYDWRISPERGDQLIKLIRDCGMDGVLEGVEACYMQKAPSPTRAVEQCRQDFSALGIVSEKTWDDEDISFSKFCLVTDENSCLERFKEETREDLEVIDRGSAFVEVVPRGHSKAAAIEKILGRYGLSLEDAWVFGDSMNDLSMFQYARNAVLMGRHDKELEPYASFITKTVEEDGIAFAMEKFGLI